MAKLALKCDIYYFGHFVIFWVGHCDVPGEGVHPKISISTLQVFIMWVLNIQGNIDL